MFLNKAKNEHRERLGLAPQTPSQRLNEPVSRKRKASEINSTLTAILEPQPVASPKPPVSSAQSKEEKKHTKDATPTPDEFMKFTLTRSQIQEINARFDGPYVHNVVATASFCIKPDVHRLAWDICAMHNIEAFSAPYTQKIKRPRSTALMFPSGNVVSIGTPSHETARLAMHSYADFLRNTQGLPCDVVGFEVCNMQATMYMNYTLDFAKVLKVPNVTYNKRLFGAIVFAMTKPKVKFLIFESGSVVIIGARLNEQLIEAAENIKPILAHCRHQDITRSQQEKIRTEALRVQKELRAAQKRSIREKQVQSKLIHHATQRAADASGGVHFRDIIKLTTADWKYIKGYRKIVIEADCLRNNNGIVDCTKEADSSDDDDDETTKQSDDEKNTTLPEFSCRHRVKLIYDAGLRLNVTVELGEVDSKWIRLILTQNNQTLPEHFQLRSGKAAQRPPPPLKVTTPFKP